MDSKLPHMFQKDLMMMMMMMMIFFNDVMRLTTKEQPNLGIYSYCRYTPVTIHPSIGRYLPDQYIQVSQRRYLLSSYEQSISKRCGNIIQVTQPPTTEHTYVLHVGIRRNDCMYASHRLERKFKKVKLHGRSAKLGYTAPCCSLDIYMINQLF